MKNESRRSFVLIKMGFLVALAVTAGAACSKSTSQYPADNTGRNTRDADGNTKTPEDQGANSPDRALIQNVRQSIVSDDSLSVNAKNVKIIAVNGKVTLRGPVDSTAEKSTVARKAGDVAGTGNVDDQLEIVAK